MDDHRRPRFMILHAEISGSGPGVAILHGLMGSCENWRSVRKALAERYHVACLDLPNHGRSPHAARMEVRAIGASVLATLDALGMNRAVVVGHSLGGKIAMQMASEYAGRLAGVAVVDIAPRAFQPAHLFILRACQQLDLAAAARRVDLDRALAASVPQAETRAFLLKNVARDPQGRWVWRVPLQTLIDNYRVVSDAPPLAAPYEGPALFVAGERSPFRIRNHEPLIRNWFPAVRWVTIPNAGHLVHADQPEAFTAALADFLRICYP